MARSVSQRHATRLHAHKSGKIDCFPLFDAVTGSNRWHKNNHGSDLDQISQPQHWGIIDVSNHPAR